jgi:hypothetical protein
VRVRPDPCESALIPQHPFPTALPAASCPPTSFGVRARSTKTARIFARYDFCVYAMPLSIRKVLTRSDGHNQVSSRASRPHLTRDPLLRCSKDAPLTASVESRYTLAALTLGPLVFAGLLGAHSRLVPPVPCIAPARPERFPPRAGVFLPTANLGFSPDRAEGRYGLVIGVRDTVVPVSVTIELNLPRTRADSGWAAQTRKALGRAPALLGASDQLSGVRLPTNDYVIIGTGDGRLGVQADVTPSGALVFVLGDHLYDGPATVFQTTVRDDSVNWRGWWWYPSWPSAAGQGYFCLRRL